MSSSEHDSSGCFGSEDDENDEWHMPVLQSAEEVARENALALQQASCVQDAMETGREDAIPLTPDPHLEHLRQAVAAKNRALLEALENTQHEVQNASVLAEDNLSRVLNDVNATRNHFQQVRRDREFRLRNRTSGSTVSSSLVSSDYFFGVRPPLDERGTSLQAQVVFHKPKGWSKFEKERLTESVCTTCRKVLSDKARANLDLHAYTAENTRIRQLSDKDLVKEVEPANLGQDFWMKVAMGVKRCREECKLQWMNHEDPLLCKDTWTKEEERRLHSVATRERFCNWVKIARELSTHRAPIDVLRHFQQVYNATLCRTGPWTEEEDTCLRQAVAQHGAANWVEVARCMQSNGLSRSGQQCLHRWRAVDPQRKKGAWTEAEDELLLSALVALCPDMQGGAGDTKALAKQIPWAQVSKSVPGRTGGQVRERWVYILSRQQTSASAEGGRAASAAASEGGVGKATRKRHKWSEEEDALLEKAVAAHGYGRWSAVETMVPGRSDAQCKKRWDVLHPEEARGQLARTIVLDSVIPHLRKDLWRRPKRTRPALELEDFEVTKEVWDQAEAKAHETVARRRVRVRSRDKAACEDATVSHATAASEDGKASVDAEPVQTTAVAVPVPIREGCGT